jgi:WD40 repeat protein
MARRHSPISGIAAIESLEDRKVLSGETIDDPQYPPATIDQVFSDLQALETILHGGASLEFGPMPLATVDLLRASADAILAQGPETANAILPMEKPAALAALHSLSASIDTLIASGHSELMGVADQIDATIAALELPPPPKIVSVTVQRSTVRVTVEHLPVGKTLRGDWNLKGRTVAVQDIAITAPTMTLSYTFTRSGGKSVVVGITNARGAALETTVGIWRDGTIVQSSPLGQSEIMPDATAAALYDEGQTAVWEAQTRDHLQRDIADVEVQATQEIERRAAELAARLEAARLEAERIAAEIAAVLANTTENVDRQRIAQALGAALPELPQWNNASLQDIDAAGSAMETLRSSIQALSSLALDLQGTAALLSASNPAPEDTSMVVEAYEKLETVTSLLQKSALLQTELSAAIESMLTTVTLTPSLAHLTTTEAHRIVESSLELGGDNGSVRIVAPRGNATTSSLRVEQRYTEPPQLALSPNHGFAASSSTIPASTVDWGLRRVDGFAATSVTAQGTTVAGVVYHDGLSQPMVQDLASGAVRKFGSPFQGNSDSVISASGSRIATTTYGTGSKGTLRIWDAATGGQIGETQRPEYVSQVGFRPGSSNDLLFSTEYGQFVNWQTEGGGGARIFENVYPRFAASEQVAAAPSLENLGNGRFGPGTSVHLYDFLSQQALPRIETATTVRGMAVHPDATMLLTWDPSGTVRAWEISTQRLLATISPMPNTRNAQAQFADSGSTVIVTDDTGILRTFSSEGLRSGRNDVLLQKSYSLQENILAHPSAPGMLSAKTANGSVTLQASSVPTFTQGGERVDAVEAKGDGTVWLDFSSTSGLVTTTSFRIVGAPAGTKFRVAPFSGTTALPTLEVQSGNTVTVAGENGLSTVAVQGIGYRGSVAIAELDVSALPEAVPVDTKPLNMFSNSLYATTWGPRGEAWGDKSLDYRSGAYAVEGDPSKFTLVNAVGGKLLGFTYHTNVHYDSGMTDSIASAALSQEYIVRMSDASAILLPGRPQFLYVNVGDGTIVGTRNGQNGGIILEKSQADSLLELLPAEGMDVRATWLDSIAASEGQAEGFFRETLTPGVLSHPSTDANSLYTTMRVQNAGRSGGAIRAEIYVSSDLSPERTLQKTITGNLGASDLLTLRFRADLPARDRSAYAYVKIIGPDGKVLAEEGAGHAGRNPKERSPEDIQDIRDGIAEAMAEARQKTIAYWTDLLENNVAYAQMAKEGLAETRSAMANLGETTIVVSKQEQQVLAASVTRYYVAVAGVSDQTESLRYGIRTDSTAGQLLLGVIEKLKGVSASADIAAIAKSAEIVTAIPWWKIAQAAQSANGDSDVLAGNLLGLFHDAGFQHLQKPSSATSPQFLSTHQHKSEYRGEDMLVRFDLATAGKEIDHVFAYLEGSTEQIGDALPVTVNGLSVRIPTSVISERMGTLESAHLQVKLVAWFKGEGDATRIFTKTDGVLWSKGIGDYSVRPESDPQNAIEDAILSQLANHFPVQDAQQWKQTIGSPYHLGASRAAIDLNLLTGENSDYGAPIFAIADGRIISNPDTGLGAVTLEHSIVVNGQTVTWRTRYLHLPIEEDGGRYFVRRRDDMTTTGKTLYEQELAAGMTFSAGEQFAVVGKNATDLAHLHLEILSPTGERIDARRVLESKGVVSKAADDSSKEWDVTWNKKEQAWVNTSQGILFVQDGNTWSGGVNNVWVAWSSDASQRARIIYVTNKTTSESCWIRVTNNNEIQRDENGNALQWINGEWQTCLFIA